MLTNEQERELVRQFESGEWNPDEWEATHANVYRITIPSEYVDELTRRAASRNESESEYISNVMGAILATA